MPGRDASRVSVIESGRHSFSAPLVAGDLHVTAP